MNEQVEKYDMSNNIIRFFRLENTLIKTVVLVIILILFKFSPGFPQKDLKNVLSDAEKLYEQGYFRETIDLLNSYLTEDISTAEKIEAYRLLAHAYFGLNKENKAEEAIIDLLFWNYNYLPNPKDRTKFIITLKDLKSKLPPPPKLPQILLRTIDFADSVKGIKWLKEFNKSLKNFFSKCDSIDLMMEADYKYQKVYNQYYFLLSGNCQKEDKIFRLDISLKEMPKLREVWRDTVTARDQRGLAESVGVWVADYFGYKTEFIGVRLPIKYFAFASGISALASVLLNNQAGNEKTTYRMALTSKDAKSSFNKLRAYEISRNSFGTLSCLLIAPIIYAKFNPRRPVFEEIKRK